jgi:hypothetical protein
MQARFPLLPALLLVLGHAAAAPDLVRNGGFVQPDTTPGLPLFWERRHPGAGERVRLEDGTYAVTLADTPGDESHALWIHLDPPLETGAQHRLSYRVQAPPGAEYRVYVEWWQESGDYGGSHHTAWLTGTGAWRREESLFLFPDRMTRPYLVLQTRSTEPVRFTDVSITVPEPEPLRPGCLFSAGFESGQGLWEFSDGATLVGELAAEGEACLRLSSREAGHNPTASRRRIPTHSGARYELSYRILAAGGSDEVTGYQPFRVFCSWEPPLHGGAAYGDVNQVEGIEWQDCFAAWQTRTLSFTAPVKETGGMTLTCEVRGPGTVLIDEIELREVVEEQTPPPPFTVLLNRPHYRNSVYAGTPVDRIIGEVCPGPDAAVASYRVELGGYEPLVVESRGAPVCFCFPVERPLDPGTLELRVTDTIGTGHTETVTITVHPPAAMEVVPREDGVLLVNGSPILPVVLWRDLPDPMARYEVARRGVDALLCPFSDDLREELDALWRVGLRAIPHLPEEPPAAPEARAEWEARSRRVVAEVQDHPALLAWFLTDEPLWCGKPLDKLLESYHFHAGLDPYHPIWINAAPRGTIADLARYNQTCDITGVDIYPVPEGGTHSEMEDKTLTSVGRYVDKMRESVSDRKPVWIVLQGFAWKHLFDRHDPEAVYPDLAQSRFMAFNALLHGSQGITYWGVHSIADPGFWDTILTVTEEIQGLEPVLTAPLTGARPVTVSAPAVRVLHRSWNGHDWLVAIHEGAEELEAELSVEGLTAPSLFVHGENRTVPVAADGRFSDRFAGYAVHVYSTDEHRPEPQRPVFGRAPEEGGLGLDGIVDEYLRLRAYTGNANWIWHPDLTNTPDATALFVREFELQAPPRDAVLLVTADDQYEVWINGRPLVGNDVWGRMERFTVTDRLRPGQNLIAVRAQDTGKPPAGLLFDLRAVDADETEFRLVSDAAWHCAEEAVEDWNTRPEATSAWIPARVVAAYGTGPWARNVMIDTGDANAAATESP